MNRFNGSSPVKMDRKATCYFRREFTAGELVGIQHDDKISFPRASQCIDWVNAINAKNAAGKLTYKIISFQVSF